MINEKKVLEDGARNWKEKKINSIKLSKIYKGLKYSKALRVRACSETLGFEVYLDGSKRLKLAYFCKDRLCPVCAWRRSLKLFSQVSKVMNVAEEKGYKFLFLTLTVQNVQGDDLEKTIRHMSDSFRKMINKDKSFKESIEGFFRVLEVTYNQETKEYHPHYHIILAVKERYFTNSKLYISQEKFTQMWWKALKVEYKPIVNIQKVKNLRKAAKGMGVINEVTKYTVKTADYLNVENIEEQKEVVQTFDGALYRKRLVSFGGVLKEIAKELEIDENKLDDDLINTDSEEEVREDIVTALEVYRWNVGCNDYIIHNAKIKDKAV